MTNLQDKALEASRKAIKGAKELGGFGVIDGKLVVTATNPQMPSFDDKSRGRKYHISASRTHTKCDMLITGYIPQKFVNHHLSLEDAGAGEDRFCAICRTKV